MPAHFTDEDRTRITESLLASGRELFPAHGLRKTSLDDLVRPAGIAKSSFYAFFDSKEALYLELLLRQAPDITRKFRQAVDEADGARDGIEAMIREGIEAATSDPLYRRLLSHPHEMEAVARKVGPEEAARARPHVLEPMVAFFRRAQEAGDLVPADPEVLVGVIRSVSFTLLHADDLGPRYPEILDLLTRSVAIGLTARADS